MTPREEDRGDAAGAHDAGEGRRSFWSGALIAVGVFALVDEMVLHLVLHWHHFYDRATLDWALFYDGLFQATGLLGLVAGLFMHDALRRRGEWRGDWQLAGLLTSLGAVGLFDATVVHKLMRLHQIRYNVEFVLPDTTWYDLTAYSCAVGSLTIGLLLLTRARRRVAGPEGA